MRLLFITAFLASVLSSFAFAQELRVATVTRPPFSMQQDGVDSGFSIDL
jgi:polar amino acid transport system substrate-binding protein